MIKKAMIAGITAAICLVSLLTGSGIGTVYGVYEKSMALFLVLFLLIPLAKTLLKGEIWPKDLILFLGLVVIIGLWPMFQGYKSEGIQYGWLLLIPFVIGQIPFSSSDVRIAGLVCGGFGAAVLIATLFLGIFGGWNPNNLTMIGFLGCAVCAAAFWQNKTFKSILLVFLAVMTLWVLQLESRSCAIGILLLVCIFSFKLIKPDVLLHNRTLRRLLLIAPALIATAVVIFQNMEIFNVLNDLSQEYFGKPVFNGRNELWEQGLTTLLENPWFGTGRILGGWWHNVGITILTAYGIVGYLLWVGLFDRIMEKACAFGYDPVLSGCTAAFLVIMFQQSFELGMVSTRGNLLPYFLLGIMLGRMRHLKSRK